MTLLSRIIVGRYLTDPCKYLAPSEVFFSHIGDSLYPIKSLSLSCLLFVTWLGMNNLGRLVHGCFVQYLVNV